MNLYRTSCFTAWLVLLNLLVAGDLWSQSSGPADPSLKLHFDFDEDFSRGEVLDVSGNGNHGWQFNPTNWITGTNGVQGNTAAQFTYAGVLANGLEFAPYIAVTNLAGIAYLTNGTISLWAKFDDTNNVNLVSLLDSGFDNLYVRNPTLASNSWTLGRNFASYLSFWVYPSAGGKQTLVSWPNDTVRPGGSAPNLSTTNFHLYTVTIDCPNNQAIAYYDGRPCMTNTIGLPWIRIYGCASIPWLCIGADTHDGTPQWGDDPYPNDAFFSGRLDDIRIYNRTLAATEVQGLLTVTTTTTATPATTPGTAYYVSTSGNDGNSGSQTQPWLTIQHAAATAVTGSTVLVNTGSYNERPQLRNGGIVFRTNGPSVQVLQGFDINTTNITLDGFDLSWTNGTKWSAIVYLWNGCSNVVIQDCYIHDSPWETGAIQFNNTRYATNGAQNCTITNNVIENAVSEYGVVQLMGAGHLVVGNIFKNNPMDLFHVFGANHVIRGNYVTNNYSSVNIPQHVDLFQTYGNEGNDACNILIEQNEFVNCADDGRGGSGGCSICQLNNRDYTAPALTTTNVTIPANGSMVFEYSLGVSSAYVTNHLSASGPVNFTFNQSYFAGRGLPGDITLSTGSTSFSGMMQCPPLLGNKAYYLTISNPNSTSVVATVWVNCSNPNNLINIHDGGSLLLEALNTCNIVNWTFRNNIFSHVGTQASIGIAGCNWYNNLFYYTTTNTAHCLNFSSSFQSLGATNGHVLNNIFYGCGQDPSNKQFGWYDSLGQGPEVLTNTFDYNMVVGVGTGTIKYQGPPVTEFAWYEPHGMNGINPQLASPLSFKFQVLSGSPALGAGANLTGLFSTDFNGNLRPPSGSWTIGPNQLASGYGFLAAPYDLRVVGTTP